MRTKTNNTNRVFAGQYNNDAIKGHYNYYIDLLTDDILNTSNVPSLEELKEKYGWETSTKYGLKTMKWHKNNFEKAYYALVGQRAQSDGYSGSDTNVGSGNSGTGTETENSYVKYIVLGVLFVGLVVLLIFKNKKK
jgi:hypothetical protein